MRERESNGESGLRTEEDSLGITLSFLGGEPESDLCNQTHMYPRPQRIANVDVGLAPLNLPRQQAVAEDADGEFVEAALLRIFEHEESVDSFQSLSTMSQVLSGNAHGPPVISGSNLQNVKPPNDVWDPDDFLELKDLDADDEYFDLEALLRELGPPTQVQATVSAPRGSHQGRIQPTSSGSHGGSTSSNTNDMNKNPLLMKIVVSVSVPSRYNGGLNHTHPPVAASVEELPNVGIDLLGWWLGNMFVEGETF